LKKFNVKNIVLAGLFLGIGLVLPFVTMQIPAIGNMLCPMHIPILLCGFICGAPYGLIIGFITPIFRGMLFGMPALLPNAACMAFELATYGLVSGLLIRKMKYSILNLYVSLIISMIVGRIVWGLAATVIYHFLGMDFTVQQFITAGFVNAIPGILIQLIIIPTIVDRVKEYAQITFAGEESI